MASGSVAGLDPEQVKNAQLISAVGKKLGASANEIAIAIMTAMDESSLHNLSGGDRDSAGLFQQRPSQGWGTFQQVTDPTYASTKFFTSLKQVPNVDSIAPWQAAQDVQQSAYSDGSNYQAYWQGPANGFQVTAQQIAAYVLGAGSLPDSAVNIPGEGIAKEGIGIITDPLKEAQNAYNSVKSIPDGLKAIAAPFTIVAGFFEKLIWIFTPNHFIKFLLYLWGAVFIIAGFFIIIFGAGKDRPA